jgi:hypothetical protein
MAQVMDRAALLKRLREKVLKGLKHVEDGPSVVRLFCLIQDLNYLHLHLLREVGTMASSGHLTPEVLSLLTGIESIKGDDILIMGKGLKDRSDGELLQVAGLLPVICLHTVSPPADELFSRKETSSLVPRLSHKDKIIAILLERLKEKK